MPRIVLATAAAALTICGCGSGPLSPSAEKFMETKIGAYSCPIGYGPPGSTGHPHGAAGSLNLRRLVGQPVAQAEAEIRWHGCAVRVLIINGHGRVRTNDLRSDRVNLDLAHGRVLAAVAF